MEELAAQLDAKSRAEGKYRYLQRLAREKQQQLTQEIARDSEQCELLLDAARQLQGHVEDSISALYKGREVNIVGEINAVLYD